MVCIPLNIKNIANKQSIIPTLKTGMYKVLFWFLKALKITDGPTKSMGNAISKYLIPLLNISLFVAIVVV